MINPPPPNTGQVRTIELRPGRVHVVMPCMESGSPSASREPGRLGRVLLFGKLWAWRRLVDAEYWLIGRRRAHLHLVEVRLRVQLWRLRLRAFLRNRRRLSTPRAASLEAMPAKTVS